MEPPRARFDPQAEVAAAIASALLLGRREEVDPDVNDAFARTGTTHLLAISGQHLQVLAPRRPSSCWPRLGLGRKLSRGVVIAQTVGYAALVGFMPSVVRSAAMAVGIGLADLRDRCTRSGNLLAFAALVTLAWNPADLFDVGGQLSFLGVAGLVWGAPRRSCWFWRPIEAARSPGACATSRAVWRGGVRWLIRFLASALYLSAVVWCLTLPLVALRFHIVSPIGILLNVPLVPMTSIALIASGLTMLLVSTSRRRSPRGRLSSATGCTPGDRVARPLGCRSAVVGTHDSSPGPLPEWTIGFYALLAAVGLAAGAGVVGRRTAWAIVGAWSVVGLLLAIQPTPGPERLEADVLAVGHGLAVAIRSPDGGVSLYDCGKMGRPRVGRRLIAPALWSRGVRRVDRVFLSHADADHFNGLPDLLDRFRIGEVLIPAGFGGRTNPEASRLLRLLARSGRPGPIAGQRGSAGHSEVGGLGRGSASAPRVAPLGPGQRPEPGRRRQVGRPPPAPDGRPRRRRPGRAVDEPLAAGRRDARPAPRRAVGEPEIPL